MKSPKGVKTFRRIQSQNTQNETFKKYIWIETSRLSMGFPTLKGNGKVRLSKIESEYLFIILQECLTGHIH